MVNMDHLSIWSSSLSVGLWNGEEEGDMVKVCYIHVIDIILQVTCLTHPHCPNKTVLL